MRAHFASWAASVVVLGAFLPLAACGGGSVAYSIPSQTLDITSTAIVEAPNGLDTNALFESADAVDWEIPLAGGCGGPYVVRVISGALPAGIATVGGSEGAQNLHHLRGNLLDDGIFRFRLEVVDTSCSPFAVDWADFTWEVERGGVKIVGATPQLYAPGTHVNGDGVIDNPVYPALEPARFGAHVVRDLIVAGGVPPYSMEVVDDPSNAVDGPLPLGVSIPTSSTSIVGTPLSFLDGISFVFTLQATDANGLKSPLLTVQWEVLAPEIVLGDLTIPDGKCGTPYSHTFTIVDGLPPFAFEFVQCDVDRDVNGDPVVTYQSPNPPIITPACAAQRITAAMYPAQNLLGPDYRSFRVPSEGMVLGDGAPSPFAGPGSISGVPRRRGTFRVFLHVYSTVAPNARGQHAWKMYEFNVAPSEPPINPAPAFDHDPAYTVGSASFPAVQPYARIGDAEVGVAVYNPDVASHAPAGLQLRCLGGVRKDGRTDAPHASEVVSIQGLGPAQEDGTTPGGGFDWTVDPNPAGDGDAYSAMPPGMALDGWTGIWRVVNSAALVRQQAQALEFTAFDQQLPTQVRNSTTRRVNFGVGPDKLLITESTTSGTTTTGANWWDMNDNAQTVRVCLPYTGAPVVIRNLDDTDLSATHTVPSTTGLSGSTAPATLLANQDMLRVCVNPAGWWNDVHNLNPAGARSGLHADRNGYDQYIWGENDLSSATDYSRQPSITSVDLPAYRPGAFNAVSHSPATGVYTDGGRFYPFSNGSYFGAFVVRSDGTLYVPFAIGTSQSVGGLTFNGFGDGCVLGYGATPMRSQLRIPHMAVSPDGRFGAMKIKTSETNFLESALTTKIVLFSLTGEKPFGGQTWCVLDSGSLGNSTTGTYLYAPSMVMTNSHLYYLCGNLNGTLSTQTPTREHFVYRFQFADPTTGAVVAGATGTGSLCPKAVATETDWTNTVSAPLQTRFQHYSTPYVSSYANAPFMHFDGGNLLENSICPLPFRVSADGRSIAILAMPDQVVSGVNNQAWHVWVDFQGGGVRKLSTAARHVTGGGTRGYTLGRGSSTNTYENWHRYHGPTPHLEISDDGSKVAVVVNRFAGTPTYTSPTTSWVTAREDVIAYRTADNVTWTEIPVTGDGVSTTIFSSAANALWRFGTLVFTKDNNGLVFWGGFSSYAAASTTSSYQISHMLTGTFYGTDVSTASAITGLTVTGLLATTDGGSAAGIAAYTTSAPYNPTLPNLAYSAVAGVIKPYGGFLSRSRDFLYVVNKGAIVASGNEYPLLGVNVRSTNTAAVLNGRTDFRAFAVGSGGNWPARRGFISGTYNYYAQYGLSLTDYPAFRKHGMGMQVMPKGTGWVFFGSHYQSNGPTAGTASSSYGGPIYATYSYDYASYGGQVEAFNADVAGPVVRLTSFTGDTSIRRIHFLEPADGGGEVAFVYDTYSTSNGSPSNEQLHAVTGIGLNASTGASTSTPVTRALESTSGRVSDAFAFGSVRDRLYYAAGSSSNENGKLLKEAIFGAGSTVTFRNLTATGKRYNVLYATR